MASRGQQVAAARSNKLHNIMMRARSHQFQDTTLRDWDIINVEPEPELLIDDIMFVIGGPPSASSRDEDIDFLDDLVIEGIPKLKYKPGSSAKPYCAKNRVNKPTTVKPVLAHENYDLKGMAVARFPSFMGKSASPKQHVHAAPVSTKGKKQDDFDLFDDIIAEEFPKSKSARPKRN